MAGIVDVTGFGFTGPLGSVAVAGSVPDSLHGQEQQSSRDHLALQADSCAELSPDQQV